MKIYNTIPDVFLDVADVYYRKIYKSPNLVGQFYVSEVVLLLKNGCNDSLKTRYVRKGFNKLLKIYKKSLYRHYFRHLFKLISHLLYGN